MLSIVHHIFCVAGLLAATIGGSDGPLVLVGTIVGELSNPIRHILKIINRLHGDCCVLFVFIPFLITRIVLVQYTAHAIIPYSKLALTKITAFVLLALSAISIWRYIVRNKKNLEALI